MTRNIYNSIPPFHLGIIQSRAARNSLELREGILRQFDLGSPEWFVLGYVASKTAEGGVKVGDIAAILDVQSTYVTGVLRRLERKDLVESRPGKIDRRVRLVTATKNGAALAKAVDEEYIKQHSKQLKNIPASRFRDYIAVLEYLADF